MARPMRMENSISNWTPRYKIRLLELGFDIDIIRRGIAQDGYYVLKKFFDSKRRGYVTEACNAMVASIVREADPSYDASNAKTFVAAYEDLMSNPHTPEPPITLRKEIHTDDMFDLFFDTLMIDVMTAVCGSDEIRLLPGYRIHAARDRSPTGPWHQEHSHGIVDHDSVTAGEIQGAFGRSPGGKYGGVVCHMQLSGKKEDGKSIELLKGSHELGPLTHTIVSVHEKDFPSPLAAKQVDDDISSKYSKDIVSIELEPGDVLIHHMFLVKRDVGKRRWCAQWAYQDGLKEAVLWNRSDGYYARSESDMDQEVQTPEEWGAHEYIGTLD
eukprot:m.92052 g.92052  ORF g.92052 m.92052 type:complete len:327 (-) comp26520_c0_seq1:52-1032(-)